MQKKLLNAKQEQILTQWNLAKDCLRGCEVWQFEQRETIITQGALLDRLLFVLGGKAKVCTLADNGKNLVLAYYISDGIIGDMEFAMKKDEAVTIKFRKFFIGGFLSGETTFMWLHLTVGL